MKYIIFDYNGTLVDDLDLSIFALNSCINKYLDRPHVDLKEYHEAFTMPVENYYRALGFTFEKDSFEVVGKHWHTTYKENFKEKAKLFDDVKEVLLNNISKGYKNVVLSACEKNQLKNELKEFGIADLFDEIIGVETIYGVSKLEQAKEFRARHPFDEMLMIGDTLHDYEVAEKMGIACVFVERGHQPASKLALAKTSIYKNLKEVEYDKNWSK